MSVNKTATAAGKRYEKDLLTHLREQGLDVERLRLSGSEDEGDLLIRSRRGAVVVEAKRCKRMDLAGWIKEAQVERENYLEHRKGFNTYGSTRAVVVHHARGKNISQSYVSMTLGEFLWLIT